MGKMPMPHFAEPLIEPRPAARLAPVPFWLLALLLLAALAPRLALAWRIDVLLPDGVIYVRVAEQLERREFDAAFSELGLNLYPPVLMLLHRSGLDWETAGKLWGVLTSSLTVLPLFGLMRRQFNLRVAVVGALLYAWHPQLIQWGPETLRDSSYWLLLTLTLLCAWRATTEVRWVWFAAAGLAWASAVHVRTEGWLLGAVVLGWVACRWWALRDGRWRLAVGSAAFAAALPALLVLLNVTWLADHSRWEWGRLRHLERVLGRREGQSAALPWPAALRPVGARHADRRAARLADPRPISAAARRAAGATHARRRQPASSRPESSDAPPGSRAVIYLQKLYKAFGPLLGAPFWLGAWSGRRALARRSQLILLAGNAALGWAVWRLLQSSGEINARYFFPAVLTALPYGALGVDVAVSLLRGLPRPAAIRRIGHAKAVVAAVSLLGIVGCIDGLSDDLSDRRARREIGVWIRESFGEGRRLAGAHSPRVEAHYAHGRELLLAEPVRESRQGRGGLFVLPADPVLNAEGRALLAPGMVRVPAESLPPGCRNLALYAPAEECMRLAGSPPVTRPRHGAVLRPGTAR